MLMTMKKVCFKTQSFLCDVCFYIKKIYKIWKEEHWSQHFTTKFPQHTWKRNSDHWIGLWFVLSEQNVLHFALCGVSEAFAALIRHGITCTVSQDDGVESATARSTRSLYLVYKVPALLCDQGWLSPGMVSWDHFQEVSMQNLPVSGI